MTGIALDTLRAWERRYGAVKPDRDDRGRLYTEAQVARLRLLGEAVRGGHAIGRLAHLDDRALKRLLEGAAPASGAAGTAPAHDTAALKSALFRFDAAAVQDEIARLGALLTPRALVAEVLVPLLASIGEEWHRGKARIGHEHLLSSIVRNVLGALLQAHARRNPPARLLFATPAGERHELGTVGAAMLAASGGLGVVPLGADLPAQEIVACARAAGADVVVVGLAAAPDAALEREIATLVSELPAGVELWVGGAEAAPLAKLVSPRGLVLADFAAYEQQLRRLGARF